MSRFTISPARATLLLSLSLYVSAQSGTYYGDEDGNVPGRVVTGIIVAVVVVILLALIFCLFYRRRRRMFTTTLPVSRATPMSPAVATGGYNSFFYPRRQHSYLGDNVPLPAGYPAAGLQPPSYTPPPPPYHRKETFQGETIEVPSAAPANGTPQPPPAPEQQQEYFPPPLDPPSAHIHNSRFGWFKDQ
ncbi:hypothetical protein WOLCODRAFT_165254 [Wolfiporia cocos MD-104 SS10]|uniref:Uncharacterized protein n=1 Tax=Wolfiporia cocos (strain MD-104) TaxID=742152 RepID=A0A2H3JR14_WOLCO|nr:hypothetical protein WOLCODRAFT_165254 [Wolfiporia cocos MD-104 SS10]